MLEKNRVLEFPHKAVRREAGAAPIGTWECLFPFEVLTWSDAVYDLFELPRGMRVTREEALGFYTEESRERLERIRSQALRDGAGFTLEAEIHTALGKDRWMRIVAHVESGADGPVRLFGTKQDITAEKNATVRPG